MKEKVAVIYPYFAHYRGPVIEELSKDENIDYYFFGGTKISKEVASLKLYDFENNSRFILIKNFWIGRYFLIQFSIIRALRKNKINKVILLADWKYLSYWLYLFYCNIKGIKCYFWSHGLLNKKMTINNRVKLFFHSLFDGGVVYSNRSKKIMIDLGFSKPIWVVNNSLDYNSQCEIYRRNYSKVVFNSLEVQNSLDIQKPYIIFTGRLVKNRKLELLFKALAYLKDSNIIINLLVLGSGPHEESLKIAVKERNISDQVIFAGACYDETLLCKYFVNSEMCVFPGPIGLTIIHAMTYGVPVITNDDMDSQKPEVEALKDGFNGYFFKNDDYLDLANLISKLMSLDDNQKEFFKKNCLSTVKDFYTPSYQADVFSKMLS